MEKQRKIILGIDPGRYVGWAIVDVSDATPRVLKCGWFNCGWLNDDSRGALLLSFSRFIAGLLKQASAAAGDEGELLLRYERPFFRGRAAESLHQYETCILLECARVDCGVRYVNPMTLKKTIAGNGRADKHEMFRALKSILPEFDFKDASGNPINDDTVDAICVAIFDVIKDRKSVKK